MSKSLFFLASIFCVIACQKDGTLIDPCNKLVDGIYNYPNVPPDASLTSAQKIEYYNIPEDVLKCFSTEGLVETCLAYHDLGGIFLLLGANGIQDGYNLGKARCRGFPELESRNEAFDLLIAKYKSIDTIKFKTNDSPLEYGGYRYFTYCLEVILGQEKILQSATDDQKMRLLTELFIKQDYRNNLRSWWSIEGTIFVMARLMYYNDYPPLIKECLNNRILNDFIIEGRPIQRDDIKTAIISFANDYFTLLKTK